MVSLLRHRKKVTAAEIGTSLFLLAEDFSNKVNSTFRDLKHVRDAVDLAKLGNEIVYLVLFTIQTAIDMSLNDTDVKKRVRDEFRRHIRGMASHASWFSEQINERFCAYHDAIIECRDMPNCTLDDAVGMAFAKLCGSQCKTTDWGTLEQQIEGKTIFGQAFKRVSEIIESSRAV